MSVNCHQSIGLKTISEKDPSDRSSQPFDTLAIARHIALTPNAHPEILKHLANISDRLTRQSVAANPNTPIPILQQLATEFPEQVLANPILPLLFIENSNILEEIFPESYLEQIVLDPETPREILGMLVHNNNNYPIQEAAQMHVNWAGKINEGWEEEASQKIRTLDWPYWFYPDGDETSYLLVKIGLIGEHILEFFRNCPCFLQTFCYAIASSSASPSPLVQKKLEDFPEIAALVSAYNPDTPAEILEQLAIHPDNKVRRAVASHLKTPLTALETLAKDRDTFVVQWVAIHPKTPLHILEQLATHSDFNIVKLIPNHPNTSIALLEQLANDWHDLVRQAVAEFSKTPPKVLVQLGQCSRDWVRQPVAKNPNTPLNFLEQLAKDNVCSVRHWVGLNASLPLCLLKQWATDRDRCLRSGIAKNINTPIQVLEELANDDEESVRESVSENLKTPIYLLEKLAKNETINVLQSVAKHLNTPSYLLGQLASNCRCEIRESIAANPNTPPPVLAQLANDEEMEIRRTVAENPQTPLSSLEQLLSDRCLYGDENMMDVLFLEWNIHRKVAACYLERCPEGLTFVLENFAHHCQFFLERLLVLLHPNMPERSLDRGIRSFSWIERYAIALHPNTPTHTLDILTKDANRIVRAAAKASIEQRAAALATPRT